MALETQYAVGRHPENNYPVIYRVIILDGTEVSRGEADFAEVKAAHPSSIEEYFNEVAAWAHELANYFDAQFELTADNYTETLKASRFFYDFDSKFDYATYLDSMPQFQAPEPTAAEETPDTE